MNNEANTQMTLSNIIIKELDSLKGSILRIEKNIESAQCSLLLAVELDNKKEAKKLDKSIEFGLKEIRTMVRIQAQSMKLEYDLVLDLIFEREETLKLL